MRFFVASLSSSLPRPDSSLPEPSRSPSPAVSSASSMSTSPSTSPIWFRCSASPPPLFRSFRSPSDSYCIMSSFCSVGMTSAPDWMARMMRLTSVLPASSFCHSASSSPNRFIIALA